MTLGEFLGRLRTAKYEMIQLRDSENNDLMICNPTSEALNPYIALRVFDWFPHGSPGGAKEVTITVSILRENEEETGFLK